MGIVLALVLAAPVVAVQTDGVAPCDTSDFARDLRALRPELEIVPLPAAPANAPIDSKGTPAGAWLARIEGLSSDQPVLRVTASPTPLLRPLPAQDCRRAVETAASIVDGLLDQLPNPARETGAFEVSSVSRPSLAAWFGVGTLQGPIQWVASFALGARLGLGAFEVVGVADVGWSASTPLATLDEGTVGNYQAIPINLEIGGGWSPRLGPGRLSLDGFIGLALVIFSAVPNSGAQLFGTEPQLMSAFFLAAAAGYVVELPARFFVGVRIEERWTPAQVTVEAEQAPQGDQVDTRRWTFTSTVVGGWQFF